MHVCYLLHVMVIALAMLCAGADGAHCMCADNTSCVNCVLMYV